MNNVRTTIILGEKNQAKLNKAKYLIEEAINNLEEIE